SSSLSDATTHYFNVVSLDGIGGTSSTASRGAFYIDTTPPSVTANIVTNGGSPNGLNSWFTTAVNSDATATDATSGIDTFEYSLDNATWNPYTSGIPYVNVTNQGSSTVYFRAQDNAGWTDNDTTSFKIDSVAPTITASRKPGSAAANTWGWNNTDVIVTYTVADSLSGVDPTSPPSDYGDDTVSTEGAGQSTSGTVYDKAGNSASDTLTGINIDKTAPSITYTPTVGTYDADITVFFSATDNLSGIAPGGASSAPNFDSYATLGDGTYNFTSLVISDLAGNSAQGQAGAFIVSIPVTATAAEPFDLNERWRWPVLELLGPLGSFKAYPMDPLVIPVPVYFYHPVTPADFSAFDGIKLTDDMYNFIEDKLQMKGTGFFGWFEEEFKKRGLKIE
ncbi:MAG: hypothetical protein ABH815_05190, partial [Candidatus Omnitrophota bacterium]